MDYQWYPGHMTKAIRQMKEDIKLIDIVIELVDARIPNSSRNPDIDSLANNKSRLVILNKSDLADSDKTKEWMEYFQQMNNPKLFEYKFCERNHAKIYIVDDKLAYVGSANVTRAGLRQDATSQLNLEAGVLTEDPELVSSIKAFFSEIWNSKWCCEYTIENKCDE